MLWYATSQVPLSRQSCFLLFQNSQSTDARNSVFGNKGEARGSGTLCVLGTATVSPLQVRKEKVPTCQVPVVMAETGLDHGAA